MDKDKDKYITVEDEKIFEVVPLLEYYEAALNGRQQEHRLRNWRDVVPEWFEQSVQLDFKDQKHVFYAFSKYFINQGRAPTKVNGAVKLTAKDLESL